MEEVIHTLGCMNEAPKYQVIHVYCTSLCSVCEVTKRGVRDGYAFCCKTNGVLKERFWAARQHVIF